MAAVLLALAVSGCDTVVDDPITDPLPPNVSFTTASMASAGFTYDPDAPEHGNVATVAVPAAGATNLTVIARLPSQLHHPETGLGEDVTVRYNIGGNAEYGVDFDIHAPTRTADGQVQRQDNAIVYGEVYAPGTYMLPYVLEPTLTDDAGHLNRFRIRILDTARSGRTLRIELAEASVPSGQPVTVGRIPGNRDSVLTVHIVAP